MVEAAGFDPLKLLGHTRVWNAGKIPQRPLGFSPLTERTSRWDLEFEE